jgi:hypothetical protein
VDTRRCFHTRANAAVEATVPNETGTCGCPFRRAGGAWVVPRRTRCAPQARMRTQSSYVFL